MNVFISNNNDPLMRLGEAVMRRMADDYRRGYANKLNGIDTTFDQPTVNIVENAEKYIRGHFSTEMGEYIMRRLKREAAVLAGGAR